MDYMILFLLPYVLLQTADCIKLRRKWTRWDEINVTFGKLMGSIEFVPFIICLAKCQETPGCVTANVDEANSKCELSTYYPPDGTMLATRRDGWTAYYIDTMQAQGSRAWQSSTYGFCVAENAIDGETDEFICSSYSCGCRCAHTHSNNSTWVMEFEHAGYIRTVYPFFRLDSSASVWRNTDFTIFVHNSFEDGKNGVNGTLCATYTGAPITSNIEFACQQIVYGKAVRIQDFKPPHQYNALQICEVKVVIV